MTKMTNEEAMKELSYIADEMPSMECANWIEAINMGIKALDQTRWIPVSERLPEKEGRYLVTCKIGFSLNEDIENDETVDMAFYKDGHWSKYILYEDIYAWMPLPELYRPDSVMIYPQVEGITPTVVEPGYNSIKTEQELSRDIEEIKEILNCDANAEIKLNMITNIINSKPHYFKALQQEEPCKNEVSISRQIEEVLSIISDQINGDNKVEQDSANDMTNKTLTPQRDDTISREAVLKCFTLDNTKADVWNNIKALPPTPQGKWIVNPFDIHNHLICDNCFASAPYNYRTKYCPNCGLPKDTGDT